jgi:hypothetical protein
MKNSYDTSIAVWVSVVMGQHHNVGVGAWFDSVLVSPIVVGGEIDAKCFVGINSIVQKEEVCPVNRFDMKTTKKKSANQMAHNFMVKILVWSHVSGFETKEGWTYIYSRIIFVDLYPLEKV